MSSLSARLLISVSLLLVFFFGATIVVLDAAFRDAGEQAQEDILDGQLMALIAEAAELIEHFQWLDGQEDGTVLDPPDELDEIAEDQDQGEGEEKLLGQFAGVHAADEKALDEEPHPDHDRGADDGRTATSASRLDIEISGSPA